MNYAIFTDDGNLLASFENLADAQTAIQALADAEPEALDTVAVVAMDDDGVPIGAALSPSDLSTGPGTVHAIIGWSASINKPSGTLSHRPHPMVDHLRSTVRPTVYGWGSVVHVDANTKMRIAHHGSVGIGYVRSGGLDPVGEWEIASRPTRR